MDLTLLVCSVDSQNFNEQIFLFQVLMTKKRKALRSISHTGINTTIKFEKAAQQAGKRAKQIMPRHHMQADLSPQMG